MRLAFEVNGEREVVEAGPDEMLLGVLRRELGLLSVRETCGIGVCGACTVLLDGEPVSSCLLLAPLAGGRSVTTVEGLGGEHPVQRAFEEVQAFQCGYCTPGMILTVIRLLEEIPDPEEDEIRRYLGGNLCRCGCYVKIVEAVKLAASELRSVARRGRT
ncbi:MAG: (2Fe-2S)-binding protein [Rubrobacteraceae bacterium]|uniref:(2Fe-2S)-binding protein n=1 Tax=Rubrobacter naiadicus TaxID=1392641 RepID=UPI00235DFC24|nr:(2Fe-2S)-binding protein [Rubrobacter naiadicus]MCL6438625.1 (2Fe-2S)-binding protein [Rubrobacteraceae bacterium]